MSEYKESTGNFWKPKKEEEMIEGLYIQKEMNIGENSSTVYYIETLPDHEVVQIWGTAILNQRMIPVRIGQQVKITYKGLGKKGKGGKQAPHIWKVEYKDAELDIDIADSIK